jgi:hypothetical protein
MQPQVEELDDEDEEQLESVNLLLPKVRGDEVLDLYERDDLNELDEFDDLSELGQTLEVKEANDDLTYEELEAMDILPPKLRDDEVLDLYERDDLNELDEFDDLSELGETLDVKEANDDLVSILSMAREQHVGTLYDDGISAGAGSSGDDAPNDLASLLTNADPNVRIIAQAFMNSAHAMREQAFLLRSLMPGGRPPKFDDVSKRRGKKKSTI